MSISGVIHTKNCQDTIERALKSLSFVDEIIVIDQHSSDMTLELVKKYTSNIFTVDDVGYADPFRNYGLTKVKSDWVVVLDADEEIPKTLANKIVQLTKESVDAWGIPRRNILLGHEIKQSGWWPDFQIRFFRKGKVKWEKRVHGKQVVDGIRQDLPVKKEWAIIHHNYQSVHQFISRLNRYTDLEIKTNTQRHLTTKADKALSEFFSEFYRRFFYLKGYEDGNVGLYLSCLQSFYEFVVNVKYWESKGKNKTQINVDRLMEEIISSMIYWKYQYKIDTAKNIISRYWWKLKRKLSL